MEFSEISGTEENQAKLMASLTFQMEKFCQIKENFFATQRELTPTEFRCLRCLKGNVVLTTKELSIIMNLSQGRITHLLNSLEIKGFIVREQDKQDRRSVRVSLAKDADEYINRVIHEYTSLHEQILSFLPLENREEIFINMKYFFEALRKWAESVEKK